MSLLQSGIVPLNLIKPSAPFTATVSDNVDLTPDSPEDTRHVVISLKGSGLTWLEGQSVGIVPEGLDALGKPHRLRLYSVASPRAGEVSGPEDLALCVKRVVYQDEAGNEVRGVASNLLCDAVPGTTVRVCGPISKHFLMPASPDVPLLMIATGTGIAPFRGFLSTREARGAGAPAFLVFGVRTTADLLYEAELSHHLRHPGDQLKLAISREQTNTQGGRMYVGDRMPELEDAVWPLLSTGQLMVYQCGMKGMETGVEAAFAAMAARHGIDWPAMLASLRLEKRWLVDTY